MVKLVTTYKVYYVDYSDGKNRDKSYGNQHPLVYETNHRDDLEQWINKSYPTAFYLGTNKRSMLYRKQRATDGYPLFPHLSVYWCQSHARIPGEAGSGVQEYGFTEYENNN